MRLKCLSFYYANFLGKQDFVKLNCYYLVGIISIICSAGYTSFILYMDMVMDMDCFGAL